MASPNSTTEGDVPSDSLKQITFRFCSECSNMLYPKEDEDAHKLQFTCRTCQYTEEATSTCVFRNVMNNAAGETAGVTQDVGSDPTVGSHVSSCSPAATTSPITTTTATTLTSGDDINLALCLRCGMILLQCDRCKDPASVEEYNQFVEHNPDFAFERSLAYARLASSLNFLDAEAQGIWAEKFAECDGPDSAGLAKDGLAQYLTFEIAMNPDADPPEASGGDWYEDDEHDMYP